jgi:predicted regulator of Ras-like GTPase activity (Roadblock/LC7/MglB family)
LERNTWEVSVAKLDLVMFEEEYKLLQEIISRLQVDSSSKVVFLVDKNGQQIAASGDLRSIDATSLASLTAGNVAATDGLAKLIGEKEFSLLFHEGEKDNLHISLVGDRVILVVIFDSRTSLGLVRLRVKRTSEGLGRIFESIARKAEQEKAGAGAGDVGSPFAEITEDDIDNLFR